jgi:hypothetical protein
MRITDIIRGILDQVDQEIQQQAQSTTAMYPGFQAEKR